MFSKPKIFVSYSSGNGSHERWVDRELASRLKHDGADVFFYPWPECESKVIGLSVEEGLMNEILASRYVLMICTPQYRAKTETQESWVHEEYSIINKQIFNEGLKGKVKFIPILRKGKKDDSIPAFWRDAESIGYLDFTTKPKASRKYLVLHNIVFGIPYREVDRGVKEFPDFGLTTAYGVHQGVAYGPIYLAPPGGKRDDNIVKLLSFKVRSFSPYWRAGFKLEQPDSVLTLPGLLHRKSLLFHVGNGTNSINPNVYPLVTAYHDQAVPVNEPQRRKFEPTVPEQKLPWVTSGDYINIDMAYEEGNMVCKIDDGKFEHTFDDVDPTLLKRVYLVAWGDHEDAAETKQREYEVEFSDISYEVE